MAFIPNQAIQAEIDKTKADGENLIRNIFPQRIKTFLALLASEDFSVGASPSSHDHEERKEMEAQEEGNVNDRGEGIQDKFLKPNPKIRRLLDILTPHYNQMNEDYKLLEMWLVLMIPKMEDGNNFGVDVLHEVICKGTDTTSIQNFTYFGTGLSEERAKAVKKVLKNPKVYDYRSMIEQLEEEQVIRIQRYCQNLYTSYLDTYDLLMKNFVKITKPKFTNSESLY